MSAELRQLGGALARSDASGGALGKLSAPFVAFAVSMVPAPDMAPQVGAEVQRLRAAVRHSAAGHYLNMTEPSVDAASGYDELSWQRLRVIRAQWDPSGLFRANRPIPPAHSN